MDEDSLDKEATPQPLSSCVVEVSNDAPRWADYLASQPEAGIYQDPRWGEVMHQVYGNVPFYLTASIGRRVVGVLQCVEQKSLLFGHRISSLPYFDAAGVIADDEWGEECLLREAQRTDPAALRNAPPRNTRKPSAFGFSRPSSRQ